MPTPLCLAPSCDKPSSGGFICPSCTGTLRNDLAAVPALLVDLEITISRQDRLHDPQPHGRTERPLPLRLAPMEARRDLLATLQVWAKHTAKRAGIPAPRDDCAGFLLSYLPSVASDPDAGDLADEIGYIVIIAQRSVDRPMQLIFVGPCDLCTADLYAHPRSLIVACRQIGCDAEYNIAERREWLLDQAKDQLLSAAEITKALPGLLPRQQKLTSSMIRGWHLRGRLAQRPPHPSKPREPRYVLGEVLLILDEIFAREASGKVPAKTKK